MHLSVFIDFAKMLQPEQRKLDYLLGSHTMGKGERDNFVKSLESSDVI